MFDATIFSRNLWKAYCSKQRKMEFIEILDIILFFLTSYERYMGEVHPNVKTKQLERIVSVIDEQDIEPEAYDVLISSYFENTALQTDHNINHFFTEGIINNRFYEKLY